MSLSLFRSGKVPAVLYLGSLLLLHFKSHHNTTGWSCCCFSPALTPIDPSWCQSGWEAIKAQSCLSCLGTSNLPWAQQGSQAALGGKMGQHLLDLRPALRAGKGTAGNQIKFTKTKDNWKETLLKGKTEHIWHLFSKPANISFIVFFSFPLKQVYTSVTF